MTNREPRDSAPVFPRKAISDWLDAHADVCVRFVVAPPGFGKTTALRAYAATPGERRRLFLALDGRTCARTIAEAFDEAQALSADGPIDIVLDDLHVVTDDIAAVVNDFIAGLPRDIYFIIASQRRDVVHVGTLFARGRIAICDQSRLALTVDDAQALFARMRGDVAPAEVAALIARTDGWPPAVAGTLREIAREPQPIEAAYERWRAQWSVPAIDLVNSLLERVPPAERIATRRHFDTGIPLDQPTLAVLHRCGFFVRFNAGTFVLMPWIAELYPAVRGRTVERPALAIGLFGRFTAHVNGVPIVWARRRDQHIIKYLALRPGGSATRTELAELFWPGMARPLAMQNLRTACSTIRRAIGSVVGMAAVDGYFTAGERLALNRTAIVCDVERFRRHVALAEAADAAGSLNDAVTQLLAAEALYGNGLFAGDTNEAIFLDDARELDAIYARVLARLSRTLIERGAPELARDYAAKAHRLGFFERRGTAGPHEHLRFAAS